MSTWLPDPVTSARAIAELYTLALLASAVLLATGASAFLLRGRPAGLRALVWRSGVVAVLIVCAGRLLPLTSFTGTLPAVVADPLVMLGRMQVALVEAALPGGALRNAGAAPDDGGVLLVRVLYILYWAGVTAVLLRLIGAWIALRATVRRSVPCPDRTWGEVLQSACSAMGIVRPVRLVIATEIAVPMTWGVRRPVIALPPGASRWSGTKRRAVLLHELAHVRGADAAFALLARLVSALCWFHPGAWWLARRLRSECELACDDRVLASGVRPSDYAELLLRTADAARLAGRRSVAMALSHRHGLAGRLASIVDTRRDRRAPGRLARATAIMATLLMAGPAGATRLAPSKDVLTALMRDARWDSRAYAVVGLAQRPDSVHVAREASQSDPNPRVRAWARLALDQAPRAQSLPVRLHAAPALRTDRP